MSGDRCPGATNSKMPTRSSGLFSTGVPVSAQLRRARDRPHDLAGRAVAVLDPLRFVEHDQIEVQARIDHHPPIAVQGFVVGDLDRRVGQLPLPAALLLISFDHRERQLGRPEGKLALPIGHQRLGANQAARSATSPECISRRIAVIACIVLPKPISSASTAATRGNRNATPSN